MPVAPCGTSVVRFLTWMFAVVFVPTVLKKKPRISVFSPELVSFSASLAARPAQPGSGFAADCAPAGRAGERRISAAARPASRCGMQPETQPRRDSGGDRVRGAGREGAAAVLVRVELEVGGAV